MYNFKNMQGSPELIGKHFVVGKVELKNIISNVTKNQNIQKKIKYK